MNKISRINLKNNSATICSLECYYKENNEASPKRIGGTGTFTAGNNKTLDLNGLGIPEGALVTAYANVKAGDDSYGDNWFTFSKGWDGEAYFEVTGSAFKTGVFFMEVTDFETNIEDMTAYRLDDAVLSLNNLETEGVYEKIKGLKYFPDLILGHVQGYTQYEKDGNLYFLFTHSTNSKYGYILQTINNSDNTQDFRTTAGWSHPAGIQCLGPYLFVPCEEGSESTVFVYDVLRNMTKVQIIKCSHRAGCIGVTDFKRNNETYVLLLVGDQQVYYAYVAKKQTLIKDLKFESFGKIDLGSNRTKEEDDFFNKDSVNCQGIGLVTDKNEEVHMLALMTHGSEDKVYMLKINIDFENKSVSYKTETSAHLINKGGIAGSAGSHFRWGAGIRVTPAKQLVILATSRNIIAGTKLDTTSWYKTKKG